MVEALWSVKFLANTSAFGSGVVVLETGRILGGDTNFVYVGSYNIANGVATADVDVTLYGDDSFSVFGPANKLRLTLSGVPAHEFFKMTGHVAGRPELRLVVEFTRRAELP